MSRTRGLALVPALVALAGAGCWFDATIPSTALVACDDDDDCVRPARCQPATGVCVVDGFDPDAPSVAAVSLQLQPPVGPLATAVAAARSDFPAGLSRGGALLVGLGASEPLRAPPTIDTDGPLTCVSTGFVDNTHRFSCALLDDAAVDGVERTVRLTVTLVDVAGNATTTTLADEVRIDTLSPTPIDAAAVTRLRAPWGTSTSTAPTDAVTFDGRLTDDAFSVVLTVDGRVHAVVAPQAGILDPVDVDGVGADALVQLVVVDASGNTASATTVERETFVATLNGKVPGRTDTNPHVVATVGALGLAPLRQDRIERAGFGLDRAGVSPAAITIGTGAWRRASEALPGVFGRGLLLADPVRGRMLRFGGLVRQEVFLDLVGSSQLIGPALGVNDAWEWNGLGWSVVDDVDPEADDRPAGRVAAAGAVDVHRGLAYVHGGNLANSDPAAVDVDDGAVLDDTWAWNGASWRRIATGGPALRGAVAMVDRKTGDLVVGFGLLTAGPPSATTTLPTACVSRLSRGAWSTTCPRGDDTAAPRARAFAAQALDHVNNTVWLFGGDDVGGGVLDELWRLDGDGTLFRVLPADGTAPPARSHAAAAWDDRRRRLLVFGGVDDNGAVLADLWSFALDTATWTLLHDPAAPSLDGLREPLLAWDDARDTLILQASELLPDLPPAPPFPSRPQPPRARTLSWHPAADGPAGRWEDLSDVVTPTPTYHPRLACGDAIGCVLFDDGALDRPLHLRGGGWHADPARDALLASLVDGAPHRPADLVAWDADSETLIALAGNDTFVFRRGAGWTLHPGQTPARRSSSGLAATAQGIVLASTSSGRVHRFDVQTGRWNEVASLPAAVTGGDAISGLQWLGVVGGDDVALVHGLKITSPSPLDICPICAPLLVPTAITTIAQRWSVVDDTLTVDGNPDHPNGTFAGFNAVSAAARDPARGRSLFFGGVGLGSDRPTPLLLSQQDGDPAASTVDAADVDGDGFPRGRVAASLAHDPALDTHVLVGGSTSLRDWGLFQAQIIADLDADEAGVIALGCLGDPICIDRRTAARLPRADLADTWLLSFNDERPAFLVDFDLAELRPGVGNPAAQTRVLLQAGGSGDDDDGSDVFGVDVAVWNGTRFVRVPDADDDGRQAAADPLHPAAFSVVVDDVVDVAQLAREGVPLRLAVTPRGRNGTGRAAVSLDDVSLQVVQRR